MTTEPVDSDPAASVSAPAPALELVGITAGYGRTTVLRDVSLSVGAGQTLALLGANGAGKTTLLRAALGLVRPQAGDIRLAGRSVLKQRPERRAREGVCLIREGRGVFPDLTVKENLALQCARHDRDANIAAALDAFPVLAKRLSQRAGTMSGGEQQMLALSRCFSTRPSIVLLDEVSMGLAPLVVGQIFAALEQLKSAGVAILLVEQYVGYALAMADVVTMLDRGRISFSGLPNQLNEQEIMRNYLNVEVEETQGAR